MYNEEQIYDLHLSLNIIAYRRIWIKLVYGDVNKRLNRCGKISKWVKTHLDGSVLVVFPTTEVVG